MDTVQNLYIFAAPELEKLEHRTTASAADFSSFRVAAWDSAILRAA